MQRCTRKLLLAVFLTLCLPLAAAAQPAPPSAPPAEKLEGVTATIQKVKADGLVVRRVGTTTDPTLPAVTTIAGGLDVPVSGQGRSRWLDLRRGDLVLVSYVKGDPLQARKVNVLPRPGIDPTVAAEAGVEPETPKERTFIGYIKRKEGDLLDVMRPAGPPESQRRAQVKQFVRQEGTVVEVLRDSWDDLKKGDRLKIFFQKGNPRPADRILVIWRAGEKPLPPGVATRLYDPEYDKSVRDVDGIGETQPVPRVRKQVLPTQKIKIPRQ